LTLPVNRSDWNRTWPVCC